MRRHRLFELALQPLGSDFELLNDRGPGLFASNGRRQLLLGGLVLGGAEKASAGLALKGFSTGGFVEYTVADAFKAGFQGL